MAIRSGDPTRYEIILEGPDTKYRVPLWVPAKNRRYVQIAATEADNFDRIAAVAKRRSFEWDSKAQAFIAGQWKIRATGRTQRDCQYDPLPLLPKLAVHA